MLNNILSRTRPALFITTCRPPCSSVATRMISVVVTESEMSPATGTPTPPAALISSSTSLLSRAPARSFTITVAPSAPRPIASARPRPAPAPVTTATRPSRSLTNVLHLGVAAQDRTHRPRFPATSVANVERVLTLCQMFEDIHRLRAIRHTPATTGHSSIDRADLGQLPTTWRISSRRSSGTSS